LYFRRFLVRIVDAQRSNAYDLICKPSTDSYESMYISLPGYLRIGIAIARTLLILLVLWQAARFVFRSDLNDELRAADALFAARRYHDARAAYSAILAHRPQFAPALIRLGIVATIRDERIVADQVLAAALGLKLSPPEFDLVRLYQGRLAAIAGQPDTAKRFWSTISTQSALYGRLRLLEAEQLLVVADYAGAEATYRDAMQRDLPGEWRTLAHTRLALLRASSDSETALAELAQVATIAPEPKTPSIDWAAALLPSATPDAQELATVLRAPPDLRAQTLGQLYLSAQLYTLAEAQFALVAPTSPSARSAAAYAAYTRWRAGDRAEGVRRLQELVERYPDEPRARALLALTYLTNRDDDSAKAQLDAIRTLGPRAPDTHLAWGQWYATQHDYVAAAEAYRRA